MRILFVNRMASMIRGGGESFDLEISRFLERLGCSVTFLSGIPLMGGAKAPIQREGSVTLRTPYLGGMRWDHIPGGWRLRQVDFAVFEKLAAEWAVHRRGQFDVIQVCELPRFVHHWKQKETGVPVSMRLTSPIYYDPVGGVQKADALIASGTTIEQVRTDVRPDCFNVPNGVDTEMFTPRSSSFRAEHGISDDEFVVITVARFATVKNHRMLVTGFAEFIKTHPSARLVLVGSGGERVSIENLCRDLGVSEKILFLGEVPFDSVPEMYAAADVKVISSDYESFSFTALEAMASGLPLVVTDTDWVPRLIAGDAGGRVIPKGDASALAAALLELAGNPELRASMGAANRDRVLAEYGWENSARILLNVYEDLVQR